MKMQLTLGSIHDWGTQKDSLISKGLLKTNLVFYNNYRITIIICMLTIKRMSY